MEQHASDAVFDRSVFGKMYLKVHAIALIPILLTVVLWLMGRDGWDGTDTSWPAFSVPLFAAMSLASLPLALWVRKRSLSDTGDFTVRKNRYSYVTKTYTGAEAAIMRISTGAYVGMAMPAQSALLGFVLGFQFQDWLYFLPFAAYSVLGFAIMYPRRSQVEAWYRAQTAALSGPGAIPPQPL